MLEAIGEHTSYKFVCLMENKLQFRLSPELSAQGEKAVPDRAEQFFFIDFFPYFNK